MTLSNEELDEILPCISGGCFHGGGCIYWQSVKDGDVDQIKLQKLAKAKLNTLIADKVAEAEKRIAEYAIGTLENNSHKDTVYLLKVLIDSREPQHPTKPESEE